jgi:hypothetical protein
MTETIWIIIAVVGGFGMVAVVMYFMLSEHGDREREEDARDYFDAHGHWPGEGDPEGEPRAREGHPGQV